MSKQNKLSPLAIIGLVVFVILFAILIPNSIYAKYVKTSSTSEGATVALWDGQLTDQQLTQMGIYAGLSSYQDSEKSQYDITGSDITTDGHGYTFTGYGFTVTTTASETAATLSVRIVISQNNVESWPEGLSVALYSVSTDAQSNKTYTFIQENQTGTFNNIVSIQPLQSYTNDYIVRFKASPTTVVGQYTVTIVASLDQLD